MNQSTTLDKNALRAACYEVARNTMSESRFVDFNKIESLSENFFEEAMFHEELLLSKGVTQI